LLGRFYRVETGHVKAGQSIQSHVCATARLIGKLRCTQAFLAFRGLSRTASQLAERRADIAPSIAEYVQGNSGDTLAGNLSFRSQLPASRSIRHHHP